MLDLWQYLTSDLGQKASAGAAGGIVRWLTLREKWQQGFGSLFVGSLSAIYLSPVMAPILTPVLSWVEPDGGPDRLASFLVGLAGTGLAAALIDIIRLAGRGLRK